MKADRFWPIFWTMFGVILLSCVAASGMLFFTRVMSVNAASVGIAYDQGKDPFDSQTHSGNFSLVNGYLYQEAFPLGLSQWTWDSTTDWSSDEQHYVGNYSLKIIFQADWAGMGINGFSVNPENYQTLTLSVMPGASIGDMYIDAYDSNGNALVRQSLSWYAAGGTLLSGQWNVLSIPLQNLIGPADVTSIAGISLSATYPGTAYVDNIQFTATPVPHAPWVEPVDFIEPPFNPFATSTPAYLPYVLPFTSVEQDHWYSYDGLFNWQDGSLQIGPHVSNDALAIFRNGKDWTNYRVETTLDWGISSVFALVVRFNDPRNYASCSFSYYGQTVQIYQMKDGVSTVLAQTPALATPYDDAWSNVKVAAQVEGNTLSCYARGTKVLSADIPTLQSAGTVGLEAWDASASSSPHTIHALEVDPLLSE